MGTQKCILKQVYVCISSIRKNIIIEYKVCQQNDVKFDTNINFQYKWNMFIWWPGRHAPVSCRSARTHRTFMVVSTTLARAINDENSPPVNPFPFGPIVWYKHTTCCRFISDATGVLRRVWWQCATIYSWSWLLNLWFGYYGVGITFGAAVKL